MHRLLERQLRRHFGTTTGFPDNVQRFIDAVEAAYVGLDEDQETLERSMELSSRELVERNAELNVAERKLRSIFENVVDGLFQLSPDGRLVSANPALATILGYPTPAALLADEGAEVVRALFPPDVLAQAGPTAMEREGELTRADGTTVWFALSARALCDDRGRLLLVEGTVRDVTRRRRLEQEREDLHARLVEASRLAGKAEVATDVLHNVGNVFNSINVSVALVTRRLEQSKLPGIQKAASMLVERPVAERGRFIAEDPKGKMLPDYLLRLAEHLVAEHQELRQEVATLSQHLDHVKRVIAMQQGHARAAGVAEDVQLAAVVEDAMRLQGASFERHGITVLRQIQPTGTLRVDKHQVLQILVNVLTNARHAMSDPGVARKELTLRAGHLPGDQGQAFVEVQDTGVGIERANLARIFSHGFTTRADGHGFGLHGAAIAAAAMGGSLVAESDGPGLGACFRLCIPVRPRGAEASGVAA